MSSTEGMLEPGERLARIFEIDINAPGTWQQRTAVWEALHPKWDGMKREYLDWPTWKPQFGSNWDYVSWRLARRHKQLGRHVIKISFVDLSSWGFLGYAGFHFMLFHKELDPVRSPSYVRFLIRHEVGHVIDANDIPTHEDRSDYAALHGGWHKESYADSFAYWMEGRGHELNAHLLRPDPLYLPVPGPMI